MDYDSEPGLAAKIGRVVRVLFSPFTGYRQDEAVEQPPATHWNIANKKDVLALLEAHNASVKPDPDNIVWHLRVTDFVDFAWDAMDVEAKRRNVSIDFDFYHQFCCVQGLKSFAQKNMGLREGQRIANYLSHLPGFDWNLERQTQHTINMHGWILTVLSHVLDDPYKYIPEIDKVMTVA